MTQLLAKDGNKITETMDEIMEAVLDISIYQGFDYKQILKKMLKLATAHSEDAGQIHINSKSSVPKNYSLKEDLPLILMCFSVRGSRITKIQTKSLEPFINLLDHYVEKYEIDVKIRDPGTSIPPSVITLPRIAATFPGHYVSIFHDGRGKTIFPLTKFGKDGPGLRCLGTTYLASCIPSWMIVKDHRVHALLMAIHYHSDRVLHSKDGAYTTYDKMMSFYLASLRSQAMSETTKTTCVKRWGLVAGKDSPTKDFPVGSLSFTPEFMNVLAEAENSVLNELSEQGKLEWTICLGELSKVKH